MVGIQTSVRRWLLVLAVLSASCAGSDEPNVLPAVEILVPPDAVVLLTSDSILHDVRDIRLDREGRVWILSGFEPHLFVVSAGSESQGFASQAAESQGSESARAFGPHGEGPGEFRNPWYLVPPLDGDSADMAIWDVGSRRLEAFRADGTHLRSLQIAVSLGFVIRGFREEHVGEPSALARFGDGFVLQAASGQLSRPRDLWESRLVAITSDGEEVGVLVDFAEWRRSSDEELADIFPETPLWASCGPDTVLLWDPDAGLRILTAGGLGPARPLAVERFPLSARDVERWVAHSVNLEVRATGGDPTDPGLSALVRRAVVKLLTSTPERSSPVRARCDARGELWLQGFSTEVDPRGYGPRWQYFTSRPITVEFPRGFQPLEFTATRIYGVQTDPLGVERPGWIPFPLR